MNILKEFTFLRSSQFSELPAFIPMNSGPKIIGGRTLARVIVFLQVRFHFEFGDQIFVNITEMDIVGTPC